jgi:hypothetical protein
MADAGNDDSSQVIGVTTSQSNINKSSSGLLNYIPIIILAIILLIGFVTWDLMMGNWQIFVSLILTFIYVAYIHYLSPKRFLDMKKDDNLTILPQAPYGRIGIFDGLGGSDIFMQYGVPLILFVAGLGMGIGSMLLSNIDTRVITPTMISIGSIMLIIGFLRGAWGIYKKINSDGDGGSVSFLSVIISIAVGIPLIVRGKQLQDKNDEISNDASISKDKQNEITEGIADVALGTGLFFQIVGFMVAGHLIWINSKDVLTMKTKYIIGLVIFVVMFILSSISVAASQKDKNIPGASELTPYGQKVYLVHGIIWLIAMVGLILTIFGQTKQYDFHNVFQYILIVIVIGVGYITFPTFIQTNFIAPPSADDKDFEKSEYYQQLRTEVIKELQKTNPNASTEGDEFKEAIEKRLSDEKKQSETPTTAMLWTSVGVSIIIVIFIFWSTKERLYLVGNGDDKLIKLKIADFKEKIINDKMNSDDWDKELGQSNIPLTVRFAKWFSLIPFLSMILILLWVSVLFTNVTTSAKTSDWIAIKFSGDMYPRVKKLLDAFFIVLIIGFVLCAILLLPFVKEMNIGGLESILKFAESVQVWQFNNNENSKVKGVIGAIIAVIVVIGAGLSWWWKYLGDNKTDIFENKTKPVVPDKWEWAIAVVVLLAVWAIPTGYHLPAGTHKDFQKENIVKRILRSILTTVYLVPWFIIVLFRLGLYSVASLTGLDDFVKKRDETIDLLKFWNWGTTTQGDKSNYVPDLRLFPIDESPPKPEEVSSVPYPSSSDTNGSNTTIVSFNETKVSAVGTLIKTLLLTMAFVIFILVVVYYVYKIDAEFVNPGGDAASKASGGIIANLDSPTAHVIYFIITIVGIAGVVAYLREKFKTANNNKKPEDYLFDDMKPEDERKPLRQLTFGAIHIIYVVLMVIVWIYDRDKDDKSRMSVTGMTILGLAILFFHYGLEFMDTMKTREPAAAAAEEKVGEGEAAQAAEVGEKPSVTDLFTNIRFVINTVFFIVLCALAYYKQHGAMVALILAMFIFHLTKSALGVKLLKLLWLGIIYIPCLFLDLLQSSQGAVGDTTRPIWIILAIEILLIAILYGGPFLINYIGASASQIVAAPISLKEKYDTNLTTQSEQIFIYHNTGMDRTPADDAANCPIEEKKRYNYSISGWFLLNNMSTPVNQDLEIFDFGGVPKLTYNSSKAELKLKCNLIDISSNLPIDANGTELYNSKAAYNAIIRGKSDATQTKLRILQDKEDSELDVSIPLQKWNYFVVNYNGKTMDLFLNTKLIFKSEFIMPDIQLKPITVGDTTDRKGLNGSVCNFSFHKTPLTKEQIRWTYTMFKSLDPPLIGMKTIQDDVKEAGTAVAAELSK